MDLFDIFFFGGEGGQPAPTPVLIEKSITENGTYDAQDDSADGYSTVTVAIEPPPTPANKNINFYDYDGTLLYGYTYAEAAALSALPALSSHEGLTAQGWTHTLAQVQAAGTDERALDVGATHTTSDGSTQLYLFVGAGAKLPNMQINVYMDANSSANVDWGDGTTGSLVNSSGSAANVYAEKTDWQTVHTDTVFCIRIIGGSFSLGINGASNNAIFNTSNPPVLLKAYIGSNCHGISAYAFNNCLALSNIVIPQNITSIGSSAFENCESLISVVIPSNITSVNYYLFRKCLSLSAVVLPSNIVAINNYAFSGCSALINIIIPQNCRDISTHAFDGCSALSSIVVSRGNISSDAFSNCESLILVVLLQGVASISDNAFRNCKSLTSIVLSQGIRNISYGVFSSCVNLYSIDLSAFTSANQISTLASSNAIPSTVSVLWVHDSSMITAFEAATNWSSFAGKYAIKEW